MWVPEKWKLLLKCTIGQSNWECNCTMRKFQDLSDTQVLREINFGHFEAPKTAILTKIAALNFEFRDSQTAKNGIF